ncbi:MAG: phosphoglucosamine mutase [Acidobacteriota bacterium]
MNRPHRLFGTDGIRGAFGTAPLDEPTLVSVAHAVAAVLRESSQESSRVVIGGDTRQSTPRISRWIGEVLSGHGHEVLDVGTIPTPGVAHLVQQQAAQLGVVVSASHNPFPDNGIKLIGADGFKFSDALEERIEQLVAEGASTTDERGEPRNASDLRRRYTEHLVSSTEQSLDGMTVVLDTGHGAASALAGDVFEALGARAIVLNAAPDGRNVNAGCGSTAPELAAEAVREHAAHIGFAFDGDADRVIMVDHEGTVRDGDEILYLWSQALASREALDPPRVVATSMTNLGLERSLQDSGIVVERCDVGDRAVVQTLRAQGLQLGGEQSGHIIHLDLGTTGDGLLTAVQIAAEVRRSGSSLAHLLEGFARFPQLLRNVPVHQKPPLMDVAEIAAKAQEIERSLGDEGRLVLRYSGTESLARIMIEGPERDAIESMAAELAAVIERSLS